MKNILYRKCRIYKCCETKNWKQLRNINTKSWKKYVEKKNLQSRYICDMSICVNILLNLCIIITTLNMNIIINQHQKHLKSMCIVGSHIQFFFSLSVYFYRTKYSFNFLIPLFKQIKQTKKKTKKNVYIFCVHYDHIIIIISIDICRQSHAERLLYICFFFYSKMRRIFTQNKNDLL